MTTGIRTERFKDTQHGFSLLEAVIASGILAFVGLVILSAIDTNSQATGTLDERVNGTQVATVCIEQIRQADFGSDYSDISENITLPDHYSYSLLIECSTDGTTFDTCVGGETLQKITIQVFHDDKPVYSMCTFKNSYGE